MISPDTLKIIEFQNVKEAQLQTLMLNSSITMTNILSYREQTTGGFTDIRGSELALFDIFNLSKLNKKQREKLEVLFNELRKTEFPSILEQYAKNAKERRLLDSIILDVLGFGKSEIDKLLDELYPAIAEELQAKG